jgi:hypothetical protein
MIDSSPWGLDVLRTIPVALPGVRWIIQSAPRAGRFANHSGRPPESSMNRPERSPEWTRSKLALCRKLRYNPRVKLGSNTS